MTRTDCIFCKIAQGVIPAPRVDENDEFFCIRDIQPQSTHHYLVISKEHVASLADAFPEEGDGRADWVGRMVEFGARVARKQQLLPEGFRTVFNTGSNGGQTVFHIHMHVLGGEPLRGHFGGLEP